MNYTYWFLITTFIAELVKLSYKKLTGIESICDQSFVFYITDFDETIYCKSRIKQINLFWIFKSSILSIFELGWTMNSNFYCFIKTIDIGDLFNCK